MALLRSKLSTAEWQELSTVLPQAPASPPALCSSRCCSYIHTAAYGHFGRNDRPDVFTWEKVLPLKVRPPWFLGVAARCRLPWQAWGNRAAQSASCAPLCPL